MMISAEQIDKARAILNIASESQENDDYIRIAYEWLDAQTDLRALLGGKIDLRHLIGEWAGCEIPQKDVDVALALQYDGVEPSQNQRENLPLTLPSLERLRGIGRVSNHDSDSLHLLDHYRFYESVNYGSIDGRHIIRSFTREALPDLQYDRDEFCAKNDDCRCYYCVYGS